MSSETDGNNAALIAAVQAQDIEAINRALDSGADINALDVGGLAALHYAVFADNAEIASLLIERGANTNLPDEEKGFGPNARGTPLYHCVYEDSLRVARLLLLNGARVDGDDPEEYTPLQFAVQEAHEEMIRLLVEYGADVNGRSTYEYNSSPLGQAAAKGYLEIVRLLLSLGADVHYQTSRRSGTALHLAAAYYQSEAVAELITRGANVNAVDKDGQTPLISTVYVEIDEDEDDEEYLASKREEEAEEQARIERGDPVETDEDDEENDDGYKWPERPTDPVPVVQLLLAHGARVDVSNAKGRTALDYVRRPENAEFRERLEALLNAS